ncbi:MAG: dTDP-4-dehydrorhamnose 3,5-epimerase [Crocinitomicaceae bacterium]|nr:dTDP-4-dehydrorhamnose 3,5-epimerase [Crocinitomicaceae bacterium]
MVEEKIGIEGLILINPHVFADDRGTFFESYNAARFDNLFDEKLHFTQDNISISKKNVLRGLHFQKPPMAQGKLVQVIKGSVLDVAVDIRSDSPTYGQHYKVELNDQNRLQLWIPEGFAHGFVALEDNTVFCYKCTSGYSKSDEMDLLWNDPLLNIDWGVTSPLLSDKDELAASFMNFNSPFK